MSIFAAPLWDVDEQSDKLASSLASAPFQNNKKEKKNKKKKLKNDLKQSSKQTIPTDGAESNSQKTTQDSGGLAKKFKAKAGSSFGKLKSKATPIPQGQDQAQHNGQLTTKSQKKKLNLMKKSKLNVQQITEPLGNKVEVESTQSKSNNRESKSLNSSLMAKKIKMQKKIVENQNQTKMERLFEVKKKQRKAKKAVTDHDNGSSLTALRTHLPPQSKNDKKMLKKLKRQAKKEKKKDALVNSNEVVLNKNKKKKMHKIAEKVSQGQLRSTNNQKGSQGTSNPSFDTSFSEPVTVNNENMNSPKKSKKKRNKNGQGTSNSSFDKSLSESATSSSENMKSKQKGRRKRTRVQSKLSDSVDGNIISSSKKFKLNSKKFKLGSNNKQALSSTPEADDVADKPQKNKLVISKLLHKADVFETMTSHDLKKKRRLEMEGRNNDSISSSPKNVKKNLASMPLRQKMAEQLKSARFRWLNEQLYTSNSWDALKYFKEDEEAFEAYHSGYRNQVAQWPVNPLDVIIKSLSSLPAGTVVADFGCGEARLAESLPKHKVHSLDLIATKPGIVACDMAHSPLLLESIDVAVFCLSLMGTNLNDFILEANRVLKNGGLLMIAEVESRIEDVDNFTSAMMQFGFQLKRKDLQTEMFIFMDFKKVKRVAKAGKLPVLTLEPCIYKKR